MEKCERCGTFDCAHVLEANLVEVANQRRRAALAPFHITIEVDPQKQDDPDLRYQLARAKHNGERIGLVVDGFTYDVGLRVVQLGSVEVKVPVTLTCPGCGADKWDDAGITCLNCGRVEQP